MRKRWREASSGMKEVQADFAGSSAASVSDVVYS
jgi:hypothetical protein